MRQVKHIVCQFSDGRLVRCVNVLPHSFRRDTKRKRLEKNFIFCIEGGAAEGDRAYLNQWRHPTRNG